MKEINFSELISSVRGNKKFLKTAAIVLCFAVAFFVFLKDDGADGTEVGEIDGYERTEAVHGYEESGSQDQAVSVMYIDVSGAVRSPGVVVLDEGSRIFHAIDAAGGLAENGDVSPINLAQSLSDGDKLYIPYAGEYADASNAAAGIVDGMAGTRGGSGDGSADNGKININTATASQLQTLTGIGAVTAEKIIEYRSKYGSFQNVTELLNVSGIGEKTLEKFIDDVCV